MKELLQQKVQYAKEGVMEFIPVRILKELCDVTVLGTTIKNVPRYENMIEIRFESEELPISSHPVKEKEEK